MEKSTKPLLFFLFYFLSFAAVAQERVVAGKVADQADGLPLPGVSILIKGTKLGTTTNNEGVFQIKVPGQSTALIVTYIGYQTTEIPIVAGKALDIKLAPVANVMNEVVITGYGSQNRKTITSAITSVKAAEIENIPASSTDQLLQGRASGVQVSSNSGTPGGGVSVRIRGTSSINASSEPLYVIDGIPVQSSNLSGLSIGGSVTNPMADINPADIESMDVLKDASATAIYGARAANGVVLITTKRGANKKATISVGMYYGSQEITNKPAIVNGTQFETLMNEAGANTWIGKYGSITATDAQGRSYVAAYADPANTINTNWYDPILRTGALRNADLSIRGGSEKVQYMISGNSFLQEGILKKSDFNRTTGRVNLDFTPIEKLKMGTSVLYSNNSRGRLRNDDNISGGLEGTYFYPPNKGIYNADDSYYKIATFENPIAAIEETNIGMITNRFLGTIFAEYEFIPGLRLRSSYSFDYSNVDESVYDNSKTNSGSAVNGNAQALSTNNNSWIQENVLSYQLNLNKNSFNLLVGTTLQESQTNFSSATGQGFPTDAFTEIVAAAVQRSSSTSTSYGIGSLFSRLNYDYDKKYLLTLNVRRDGSSRFGKDNRWGTFPSVGLGWVVSEESFMKDKYVLSTLKLRASIGVTGNQSGILDFQSRGLWAGGAYADVPGIAPTQMVNPDLKWETTQQTDIGVDLGFLENRINVTADYYYKRTKDLLLAVSIPRTSGFDTYTQNYGEMKNEGFEIGINSDIFKNEKNFNWNFNFNIATNKNKILKLAAPFNVYNRDIYRYEEGGEMYSFFLNPQTGVDPQTGNIQFEDVNGDGKFDSSNDRKIVGTANPDFYGGITNTLNYKGFDLMFFFQYSYGNEQLNWNRFFQEHGGTRSTNYSTSQLDRWQNPGDNTMIPKMTADNYASDLRPSRFLEDGSYMRLKNITLGYKLSSSLAQKIKMSAARIYVSAQNIWTITNYTGLDPELTGTASNTLTQGIEFYSMPQPKTIMAGINVTF
ncbi:MAG TPA: TonB-dependent receptor [Pedobacter sp.]|uniref:SusC/RagA family TonB-linked outer membrane protein n=1 Tax=Pedobacter sp. TaxID=1411316 RepID=UPI002C347481|nr:TonB-dependent receptor [Pedobacter sp.]HMI02672.1 TonB-dependent receptor [Pedobacter sp.]